MLFIDLAAVVTRVLHAEALYDETDDPVVVLQEVVLLTREDLGVVCREVEVAGF